MPTFYLLTTEKGSEPQVARPPSGHFCRAPSQEGWLAGPFRSSWLGIVSHVSDLYRQTSNEGNCLRLVLLKHAARSES